MRRTFPGEAHSAMQFYRSSRQSRIIHWFGAILSVLVLLFPAAGVAQQPHQELLSQADQILKEMSRLTGLPIKGPVKNEVVSRPEIEKYLVQNLHQEMTPQELHVQEALMRVLGVVPRDFDLEKFLINFYTEQAAGFYDPKRKTMFIADWIPEDLQSMVLAHELTHALQDQSWDLDKFMHATQDNDDATAAREAVVEGYATAAMFQQAGGGLDLGELGPITPLMEMVINAQFSEYPAFTNAPYFFRMQALFPYVQGLGFVQAGLKRGGWQSLNAFFENPPAHTEEIFEPQNYFDHKVLPTVALAPPPALQGAPHLQLLSDNTLGELGYYSLLGQLISEEEAKTVGPAWLADRYLLYERPGTHETMLVARVRWASMKISQTFFRDYHSILAHKYPDLTPDQRSGPDVFIGTAANGVTLLLRVGEECRWAEGVPPAQADGMLAWLRGL